MRNLTQEELPLLGAVTFGSITLGMILEAHALAEQAKENEQANVFTNFVLAGMFVDPQKTPEDVDKLSVDTLMAVVDVAVDRLTMRDQFIAISSDLPIRERFFKAYLDYEKGLFKGLSAKFVPNLDMGIRGFRDSFSSMLPEILKTTSFVEQMIERLSSLATPVPFAGFKLPAMDTSLWTRGFDFSDIIVRLGALVLEREETWTRQVQEMTRGLDDIARRMSADLAAVALSIQQTTSLGVFDDLRQLMHAHEDVAEAFKAAGWPIAPSMPFELRERVVVMHKQGKTRYISRTIIGYYQRDNHQHLIETVESWDPHPLFIPRMHILRDALLQAHCRGLYTLSVPALIPQVEGLLNDYVLANGLIVKLGKIQQVCQAVIGDTDEYSLSRWVIATTLLYQLQTNTYVYTDFLAELKKSASRRKVTRHTVSHGVALNYDRPVHSLKCFLLLDALSALQEL